MEDKVLERAMKEVIKVFKEEGYSISSKSIGKNGTSVSLNVIADEPK